MKFNKILIVTLAFLSFIGVTILSAHSAHFTKSARSPQKSYEFRVSAMTIYKWYLSPMGAMIKGKTKFDAKLFSAYAKGLEVASKMNLLQGFPKGSSNNEIEESSAKPKIWQADKDFVSKFNRFQKEAKVLASIAKNGELKAITLQFDKTAGTCSACHKQYKAK